jgi:hypothetical protein
VGSHYPTLQKVSDFRHCGRLSRSLIVLLSSCKFKQPINIATIGVLGSASWRDFLRCSLEVSRWTRSRRSSLLQILRYSVNKRFASALFGDTCRLSHLIGTGRLEKGDVTCGSALVLLIEKGIFQRIFSVGDRTH